jgi:hypothetical protein
MNLTTAEYYLLDDVLARLIDAKCVGFSVRDEHFALLLRLQRDHEHVLAQRWADDRDVVFCALCGESWGDTGSFHHGLPFRLMTYREDGIDWPSWSCRCGCGAWGAHW